MRFGEFANDYLCSPEESDQNAYKNAECKVCTFDDSPYSGSLTFEALKLKRLSSSIGFSGYLIVVKRRKFAKSTLFLSVCLSDWEKYASKGGFCEKRLPNMLHVLMTDGDIPRRSKGFMCFRMLLKWKPGTDKDDPGLLLEQAGRGPWSSAEVPKWENPCTICPGYELAIRYLSEKVLSDKKWTISSQWQ